MYIVSLILAILAFILAFIPKYGFIGTVLVGLISVIISAINLKMKSIKKIIEASIISIVVVIIAVIFSILFNVYIMTEYPNTNKDGMKYEEMLIDIPMYNVGENIEDEHSKMIVKSTSAKTNELEVEVELSFKEEGRYCSNYNFYIIDNENDIVYYPSFEIGDKYLKVKKLEKDQAVSGIIKFILKDGYDVSNMILVYDDNVSIMKIKI